jgi:sulfur relay (sulfurtransferase) DsrF/TusC family protein
MNVDKSQQLAEFISLSQRAKQEFFFLADYSFALVKETLPKSLSYRDGFIFNYQSPEMSVDV